MSNSNVSDPESGGKMKSVLLFIGTFLISALVLFQVFTILMQNIDVSNFYLSPEGLTLLLTVLSSLMTCVIGAVVLESIRNSKKDNAKSKSFNKAKDAADQSKNVA